MKQEPQLDADLLHDWSGPTLLVEDWNFRACSNWQQPFCLEYECHREFEIVRRRVADYRQAIGKHNAWDWDSGRLCVEGLFAPLAFMPDFPEKPWLSIQEQQRKKWVLRFGGVWLPEDEKKRTRMIVTGELKRPTSFVRDVDIESLNDGGVYQDSRQFWDDTGLRSLHVFCVDWSAPDTKLTDDFARWLQDHRPTGAKPLKGSGQTSEKDVLKMLGARRLLVAYGLEKADEVSRTVLGDSLYSDERAWRRAKAKAEAYLKKFPRFFVYFVADR